MEFNDDARSDTSGVQGSPSGSGSSGGPVGLGRLGSLGGFNLAKGGLAGGGIGIAAILVFVLIRLLAGSSTPPPVGPLDGMLSQLASGAAPTGTVDSTALRCSASASSSSSSDCRALTIVNSVQAYWSRELAASGTTYTPAETVFFSASTPTGCGTAEAGIGPFYCASDRRVYIDLGFWSGLEKQFGAHDALFAQAFVLAHEFGHHVQALLGTTSRVSSVKGEPSGSIRLELQADCFAGVWAHHAAAVAGADGKMLISDISSADVSNAVDTAGRIGDDFLQSRIGNSPAGPVSVTHGSSAQRTKWFTIGATTGKRASCNTFDTNDVG